jgi:hypothetical protein
MSRSRMFLTGACLVAVTGFILALGGTPRALAKGKADAHLRYAGTYAEAVAQARARNTVIFVSFHKDN